MNKTSKSIENAVFRETKETFSLHSYDEDQQALVYLINQAQVSVKIYSHLLCPAIFNSELVVDACERFCLKNHRTHIEILVQKTRPLTNISHRLLSLAHKHISSVSFKKLNPDISQRTDDFVCFDRSAYFQLPNAEHYEAICNFSDASRTAIFSAHFNDAWERSHHDPELRMLLL
ncbi:MAG: GNAT family acetyltransferase [Piscirickettsiaceae bacterium]|nr:MAG: GNAT family acetyltransferase [Piscirickettsiaceae bacterium]